MAASNPARSSPSVSDNFCFGCDFIVNFQIVVDHET
jgi:hypothetical protein